MANVAKRIMRRVAAHGKGQWVCTPKDFLDFGSRAAVDAALSRLVKAGKLRRVGRGLYDLPVYSRLLKKIAPVDMRSGVDAIVRRDGLRIMPSGITAAHGLGLTNAVPAKAEYVTNGSSRVVQIGGFRVRFQHAGPRRTQWAGTAVGVVAQALRWLGPYAGADPRVARSMKGNLSVTTKRDLIRHIEALPVWSRPMVRTIAADPENPS